MNSKEFENLKSFFKSHVEDGLIASMDNINKILNQNSKIKKSIQLLKAEYKLSRLINEEIRISNTSNEVDIISKELKEIKHSLHEVVGSTTLNRPFKVSHSSIKLISIDCNMGIETGFLNTNELGKSA